MNAGGSQVISIGLLLAALGSGWALAIESGVTSCEIGAWSTDTDPNGLNIRSAPGTGSPIIGNIPPPTELEGDPFASEVTITGSRDGWFRISQAYFTDYYWGEKDQVFFEGEGWVSGRYLGFSVEGARLYRQPSHDGPVAFDFSDGPEADRGPDYLVLERLHACEGYWVDIEGTYSGTRVRGWTNDTCANQVTTCP